MNFLAGILKVAHLLLLLLVSVLGAPNAEIEKVLSAFRNAFRTGIAQNAEARLNVPHHLEFLNERLLQVQRRVTEAVDQEMTELLSTEIDALFTEGLCAAPDLQPIYTWR